MLRAVFLDRDGVLNRSIVRGGKPYPPATLDELELIEGVEDACIAMKREGLLLIVVTNQPDIARGKTSEDEVDLINGAISARLPLDEVLVCPHDDGMGCDCRKPLPGLLMKAAKRYNIDLTRSVMVGDRWRDIAAGRAAGCQTVFIDYRYQEARPDAPDYVTTSLAASLPFVLSVTHDSEGSLHVSK